MFDLIKTVSLFIYPLGIAILLVLTALAFLLKGWRRRSLGALCSGLAILWLSSMPAVGNWALWQLEHEWPDQPVEALPSASAVVVLGGAFSSGNGRFTYPSASGSVDRYWHAARIFHAGKAPLVVLSGGRQPNLTAGPSEAEAGRLFLIDMGVPPSAIILDTQALTTRENAVNIAAIVDSRGLESLLVVTSASHMRRSMNSLARVDAHLIPAATDFNALEKMPYRIRHFLPSASGLAMTTTAVHEVVGSVFYALRK